LWLNRQAKDVYTKQAVLEGFRSRSAYKLIQIDDMYHILKSGYTVLDCGAAPGGWTQVAAQRVTPSGYVIGVDLLPIEPIASAHFIQADIHQETVFKLIQKLLANRPLHVVMR
jgi:23S rRNA (uridine2552-2'-O)-methyltransferase